MKNPRRLAAVITFLLLPIQLSAGVSCQKIVAVGDLHGAYERFVAILEQTGLIDGERNWIGEDACLVQTGDMVDRGARSQEILDFAMALEAQAPDRVHSLLGNHEVMNIIGDLRYVDPGEFAAFAGEETEEQRAAGFEIYRRRPSNAELDPAAVRKAFDEAHPPGWFAHRDQFAQDGRYGSWLLEQPAVVVLNGTLFVHGGISLDDARKGVEKINSEVWSDIREFLRLRDELVSAGWFDELTSYGEAYDIVFERLEKPSEAAHADAVNAAKRFMAMQEASYSKHDGPVWNRRLARAPEEVHVATLEEILKTLGIERAVHSHTPTESSRIMSRFDNRVFGIDTGAGPTYKGRISALVIREGQGIQAVYQDGSRQLVSFGPDDSAIEKHLLEGKVISSKEIGTGISRPKKLVLEHEGRTMKAAFKTIDKQRNEAARKKGKIPEHAKDDRYHYDRAAWLLDRHLGLNMVPVSVLRRVEGRRGVVVQWISDAVDEQKRRELDAQPADAVGMRRQLELMRLFDALILNSDRNLGNRLYTRDGGDWTLHLIDHSRSFRRSTELPAEFTARMAGLPRPLYERLKGLSQEALMELLDGLVTTVQVKALFARRDKIVEKIESDRKRYGDALVFHDVNAEEPAAAATGGQR